ncbi:hypothetical protein HYV57_02870 [Candidatus Peregrinibacteria bacterium]|nr:hypothetical protein [Candidatus Peregrinibacteria bacterium]
MSLPSVKIICEPSQDRKLRDNAWLMTEFETLWKQYFSDIERKNPVMAAFGRPARVRLGSIRLTRKKVSKIIMNGHFRDPSIPNEVVQAILAHEMTHYAQGFGSQLEKKAKFPHRCALVDKELIRRGFGETLSIQKKWTKNHWQHYIEEYKKNTKKYSFSNKKTRKKNHSEPFQGTSEKCGFVTKFANFVRKF